MITWCRTECSAYVCSYRMRTEIPFMAQAGISVSPLSFCDHYYVGVLLRYYYARAKELQVTMSIHASLPEHPGIAEENLCVVLGKLLENALEASVSAPNKHPRISVSMAYRDAVMAIEIQNTYTGELISDGRGFHSTKQSAQESEQSGFRQTQVINVVRGPYKTSKT